MLSSLNNSQKVKRKLVVMFIPKHNKSQFNSLGIDNANCRNLQSVNASQKRK